MKRPSTLLALAILATLAPAIALADDKAQPVEKNQKETKNLLVTDGESFGAPAFIEPEADDSTSSPQPQADTTVDDKATTSGDAFTTDPKAIDPKPAPAQAPNANAGGTAVEPGKTSGNSTNNSTRQQVFVPGRYVFVFLAWVDEPYIAYRVVPDPYTGTVHRIPVVRYNRRLVKVYLDRVTNSYGYFDQFGNPVPYQQQRYRWNYNPF